MKRIIMVIAAVAAILPAVAGVVIPRQEVYYNINYKWGFIDVMIARGNVIFESDGSSFSGTLDGSSIPWEGKIICVSDTLKASFEGSGTNLRQNVSYQSGWYRRPPVSVFHSNTYNPDDPAYYKSIAGQGDYDASHDSMEAIAVTSDMIGMFYFSHALDFAAMQPGTKVTVPISGGASSKVVITYNGKGSYATTTGDTYPTYDCTFEYAYGGRMSGYPVECKVGVTSKTPLFFGAQLPMGRVELLYEPSR